MGADVHALIDVKAKRVLSSTVTTSTVSHVVVHLRTGERKQAPLIDGEASVRTVEVELGLQRVRLRPASNRTTRRRVNFRRAASPGGTTPTPSRWRRCRLRA